MLVEALLLSLVDFVELTVVVSLLLLQVTCLDPEHDARLVVLREFLRVELPLRVRHLVDQLFGLVGVLAQVDLVEERLGVLCVLECLLLRPREHTQVTFLSLRTRVFLCA